MKMMRPLEQFVCDTCGQIITSPKEGWVEWIYDPTTTKAHSFRICHHQSHSPLGGNEGCYKHGGTQGRADAHLHHFLENRMVELLQFIDVGEYHDEEFSGPHTTNLREWAELARRIGVPYYEQARLYWDKALSDGYFEGANEIYIYSEAALKTLIEKYGDDAD